MANRRRGRHATVFAESINGVHDLNNFNGPMQRLGGVVLNDKYDIKFSPAAASTATATRFATKHKLRARTDEDINGDEINDVVLYDVDGNPVYINGFRLATYLLSPLPAAAQLPWEL